MDFTFLCIIILYRTRILFLSIFLRWWRASQWAPSSCATSIASRGTLSSWSASSATWSSMEQLHLSISAAFHFFHISSAKECTLTWLLWLCSVVSPPWPTLMQPWSIIDGGTASGGLVSLCRDRTVHCPSSLSLCDFVLYLFSTNQFQWSCL